MYLHLHATRSFDLHLEGMFHFVLYYTLLLFLFMTIRIKSLITNMIVR